MEIHKIGSTGSIQPTSHAKKTGAVPQADAVSGKDSVELSEEGKAQALYNKAFDVIQQAPDIRMDKVEEAKKLLESFKEPSEEILEEVSQRLLREFLA